MRKRNAVLLAAGMLGLFGGTPQLFGQPVQIYSSGDFMDPSASMNGPNPQGFANSLSGFSYGTIAAPVLHVHNENDACPYTPYSIVKEYSGENLVTVRGGAPEGDPCGARHLHSYQGREELVVRSIISWIKTKKVDRLIGE